jgi:ribonuclease P protein subunit POP4
MNIKSLAREELIGLDVTISKCKDTNWKGKTGIIIDETKKTFLINTGKKNKIIAKRIAEFEFNLDGKKITLDGSKIIYKSEDRIKKIR